MNRYARLCIAVTVLILSFILLDVFLKLEYGLWLLFFTGLSLLLFIYIKSVVKEKREYSFLLKICIIGFSIRLLVVIAATLTPSLQISGDDGLYIAKGLKIAEEWRKGHFFYGITPGHFLYNIYNAVIFYLFGFYPSLVKILNSFFGILACLNIYLSAKKLFDVKAAKVSAFLMAFFPSLIAWQTMNLKEALIVFFYSIIIRNLIYMRNCRNRRTVIATMFYVLLLTVTRNYAGVFMGVIACLYLLVTSRISTVKKVAILLFALFVSSFLLFEFSNVLFRWNLLTDLTLSSIDERRKIGYQGGSQVLLDMSISTPSGLLKFLPLALLYFMFAPFPWQMYGSILQKSALLENFMWYILFGCFFVKGTVIAYRKEKTLTILLLGMLLGFTSIYTISMGNMGLAYRMKGQLLPVFFLFISAGMTEFYRRWVEKRVKIRRSNPDNQILQDNQISLHNKAYQDNTTSQDSQDV